MTIRKLERIEKILLTTRTVKVVNLLPLIRISRLPANHAHPPVSVAHSNVGTSPRQLDKEEELLLYYVAVAYWSGLDAKF